MLAASHPSVVRFALLLIMKPRVSEQDKRSHGPDFHSVSLLCACLCYPHFRCQVRVTEFTCDCFSGIITGMNDGLRLPCPSLHVMSIWYASDRHGHGLRHGTALWSAGKASLIARTDNY